MKAQIIALAAILTMAGCTNYRLGSTLQDRDKLVHMPSVTSRELLEPGLDAMATSAVLREIQREGTLVLTDENRASTTLEVELVRFLLEPIRYKRDDTRTPGEYRATLTAEVHFRRVADGALIFAGVVEGETDMATVSDMGSAKAASLPEACDDLARKILDRCTSAW